MTTVMIATEKHDAWNVYLTANLVGRAKKNIVRNTDYARIAPVTLKDWVYRGGVFINDLKLPFLRQPSKIENWFKRGGLDLLVIEHPDHESCKGFELVKPRMTIVFTGK